MSDDLTIYDRATLLLLTAVATEVVENSELKERFGVTITGKEWRGVNDRKLVKTQKRGRSLVHTVEEDGWAMARSELAGELPNTALARAASAAIADQLSRYLDRSGLALADVFKAPDEGVEAPDDVFKAPDEGVEDEGAPTDEEIPAGASTGDVLQSRIRAVYWAATPKAGAWVLLTEIREQLGDVSRAEVDDALLRLDRASDVTLSPESNRQALTPADKTAALKIGQQKMHLLAIEGA
jgi:hypothetical protein